MSGHLVILDKYPRVWTMGVGETRWRVTTKCMLNMGGQEKKEDFGKNQICGGMEAGIEGEIHAMRFLWA